MVTLIMGSIFDSKCDLLIVPCNSNGGISDIISKELKKNNLPTMGKPLLYGDVFFKNVFNSNSNISTIGYAASVGNYIDGNVGNKEVKFECIERIMLTTFNHAIENSFNKINIPLLATGAGKLTTLESFSIMIKHFLNKNGVELCIHAIDSDRYEELKNYIGSINADTKGGNPLYSIEYNNEKNRISLYTSNSKNMNNVIFLGAGASKSDGAPLQAELFNDYFEMRKQKNEEWSEHGVIGLYDGINDINLPVDIRLEIIVKSFFQSFYGIVQNTGVFPTFEEALGILDLAANRKELFYNKNNTYNLNPLKQSNYSIERLALILSMAEIIDYKLKKSNGYFHNVLIKKLSKIGALNSTTFISTNYDILIDNAIIKSGLSINYGFAGRNGMSNKNDVALYKIHGSLNWLYCPVCKNLRVTKEEKGTLKLLNNLLDATCEHCGSLMEAVIVPPTFFKDYQNIYLNNVWNSVEQALNKANNIIFCGYSFPDADIYIKYLLKRCEIIHKINDKRDINIYIINNFNGKTDLQRQEEENRYMRFFVNKVNVKYTCFSFEEFAKNPELIIKD